MLLLAMDEWRKVIVAYIGIVHRSVPTDQQLRVLILAQVRLRGLQEAAEPNVRVDHIRNSLCRVKASNLHDIVARRPLQLIHLLFRTQVAEFSHVEGRIPMVEVLVQTVQPESKINISLIVKDHAGSPVSGSTQERQFLNRNITRHELV